LALSRVEFICVAAELKLLEMLPHRQTGSNLGDAHPVLTPAVEGFPPTQQFSELAEAQTILAALSL
jgi:hypothetical protein